MNRPAILPIRASGTPPRRMRIVRNERGTALTEFAILLPVLLVFFAGGYQLTDASACKRRVGIVNRALADMTTRYTAVTQRDVETILSASTQIMSPYDPTRAMVRVTAVTVDAGASPKVVWSRARNGTERTVGSVVTTMPAGLRVPGMSYVMSETSYSYNAGLQRYGYPMTFDQSLFMLPRKSATVDWKP